MAETGNEGGDKKGAVPDDSLKQFAEFQNEQVREFQQRIDEAAADGLLPAPDIAVDYVCECGSKNTFHMKSMTLKGGLDVLCARCGAMLHVPPTVLDHSEYWSAGGGASLVPNWRDQMKIVRHGDKQAAAAGIGRHGQRSPVPPKPASYQKQSPQISPFGLLLLFSSPCGGVVSFFLAGRFFPTFSAQAALFLGLVGLPACVWGVRYWIRRSKRS